MTFDSFVLEMYFINREERSTWNQPKIPFQEYINENRKWLEEMYEIQESPKEIPYQD